MATRQTASVLHAPLLIPSRHARAHGQAPARAAIAALLGKLRLVFTPANRAMLIDAAILLAVALVLRASTFGNPNVGGDEGFYQTMGIAMHHGAVPYVDIWDRKPWGLFFLYYLITGIDAGPLGYQIAALLFVSTTAFLLTRIAARWSNRQGALFAGIAYLMFVIKAQGYGGQTPVFYNLFMVLAAYIVLRALPRLREGTVPAPTFAAMALAGIAITCKQTAYAEAAYLGLTCSAALLRAPRAGGIPLPRYALCIGLWAVVGAMPFAAISFGYWLAGYWDIYFHAMVTGNTGKTANLLDSGIRLLLMFTLMSPLLVLGLLSATGTPARDARFVWYWLLAAFIGIAPAMQFYSHYALSLLPPACLAGAHVLSRRWIGPLALAFLCWFAVPDSHVFDYELARKSRASFAEMTRIIDANKGHGPLFVFEGPALLYPLTGHRPPTPLVFSTHMTQLIENNVSHLDTVAEVRRVLALRPGIIVAGPRPKQAPPNLATERLVRAYIATRCQLVGRVPRFEYWETNEIDIWARCNEPAAHRNLAPRPPVHAGSGRPGS